MRKPSVTAASMVAAVTLAVPAPALARQDRTERSIAEAVNSVRAANGLAPRVWSARPSRGCRGAAACRAV
jgi:hypothetical protein